MEMKGKSTFIQQVFTIWGGVIFQNPKKIAEIVDIVGGGGLLIRGWHYV